MSQEKADILRRQIESVFTKEEIMDVPILPHSPYPDMPDIAVHIQGIEELLKKLSPSKTSSTDVQMVLLKESISSDSSSFSNL